MEHIFVHISKTIKFYIEIILFFSLNKTVLMKEQNLDDLKIFVSDCFPHCVCVNEEDKNLGKYPID